MFKMFTEQEVPKSAFDMAYSRADPDLVSRLIRACRWLLWAVMFASLALMAIHYLRGSYRVTRIDWLTYFASVVANYALYRLERRRKKNKEKRQRRDDITA